VVAIGISFSDAETTLLPVGYCADDEEFARESTRLIALTTTEVRSGGATTL